MNPEDELKKRYGCENPFKLPDNYFDDFADRVMKATAGSDAEAPGSSSRVNVRPRRVFVRRLRPYLYLAAMFAGLYFGVQGVKFAKTHRSETAKVEVQAQADAVHYDTDDQYIDDVCDYAGINKEEIYSYVTSAE